jgi:hypothetical protein
MRPPPLRRRHVTCTHPYCTTIRVLRKATPDYAAGPGISRANIRYRCALKRSFGGMERARPGAPPPPASSGACGAARTPFIADARHPESAGRSSPQAPTARRRPLAHRCPLPGTPRSYVYRFDCAYSFMDESLVCSNRKMSGSDRVANDRLARIDTLPLVPTGGLCGHERSTTWGRRAEPDDEKPSRRSPRRTRCRTVYGRARRCMDPAGAGAEA